MVEGCLWLFQKGPTGCRLPGPCSYVISDVLGTLLHSPHRIGASEAERAGMAACPLLDML